MGRAEVRCGSGYPWAWLGDLHAGPALPFRPRSIGPSPPAFPESSRGESAVLVRTGKWAWRWRDAGRSRESSHRLAHPGHWSVAQVMHCREAASILEAVRWPSGCPRTPPWEPKVTPRERAEEQLSPTGPDAGQPDCLGTHCPLVAGLGLRPVLAMVTAPAGPGAGHLPGSTSPTPHQDPR